MPSSELKQLAPAITFCEAPRGRSRDRNLPPIPPTPFMNVHFDTCGEAISLHQKRPAEPLLLNLSACSTRPPTPSPTPQSQPSSPLPMEQVLQPQTLRQKLSARSLKLKTKLSSTSLRAPPTPSPTVSPSTPTSRRPSLKSSFSFSSIQNLLSRRPTQPPATSFSSAIISDPILLQTESHHPSQLTITSQPISLPPCSTSAVDASPVSPLALNNSSTSAASSFPASRKASIASIPTTPPADESGVFPSLHKALSHIRSHGPIIYGIAPSAAHPDPSSPSSRFSNNTSAYAPSISPSSAAFPPPPLGPAILEESSEADKRDGRKSTSRALNGLEQAPMPPLPQFRKLSKRAEARTPLVRATSKPEVLRTRRRSGAGAAAGDFPHLERVRARTDPSQPAAKLRGDLPYRPVGNAIPGTITQINAEEHRSWIEGVERGRRGTSEGNSRRRLRKRGARFTREVEWV